MLYGKLMQSFYTHRVLFVIMIASLGIALGALWEVTEWLADFVIAKQIVSGLPDTITDIMLDSAGALVAAVLNLHGLNEHSQAHASAANHQSEPNRSQHVDEPAVFS